MAQDTALLRYLLKWARRAPWSWSQRDLAFEFDWTNDYISSNATIGRTGYDMNVSGNVTTGSDGDGDYIFCNWNRSSATSTGTVANIWPVTTPAYTQATNFSFSFKFNSANLPAAWYAGIFGSGDDFAACLYSSNNIRITSKPTYSNFLIPYTPWTTVTIHVVYQASTGKAFGYKDGVLQNSWWTAMSATFTTNNRYIGDLWNETLWTVTSVPTKVYHACIRNKALSQAEIDADIALWNTTKQDPSIVAYYVPENLQYNTQYIANPKALDQSPRAYTGATVTANTDVAPDGTTTADNIVFWAATHRLVQQTITAIAWSALASKTFIVKAFVKCTTGTQTFRFRMDHAGVDTNQYSSDYTVNTTRQEFTFTRTLTSSTSWTWLFASIANNAGWTAQTIQVRNVRVYLVNETLRDESPNIGGYLWWKTQKVLSCRVKPNSDTANTPSAWGLIYMPRCYLHDRWGSHTIIIRYDDRISSRQSVFTVGWPWFRDKIHVLSRYYRTWSAWWTKIYINWELKDSDVFLKDPPIAIYNTSLRLGKNSSTYFATNIRDVRIYTFTDSFTDSDAMAIYNGWEPISSWITKYLHYKPPVGEVWTTTQDQSPNDRDWTLNGGVTRDYI